MKKYLLLMMAVATLGMMANAATKYKINVGGVEVTSDNKDYITGGAITNGYGVYNPSTKTLTLYHVNITRTTSGDYALHNRDCEGLEVRFEGTCNLTSTKARAIRFNKSGDLVATSGSTVNITGGTDGAIYFRDYAKLRLVGPGTFNIKASKKAAIQGRFVDGSSPSDLATREELVFYNDVNVTIESPESALYNIYKVVFNGNCHVTLKATNNSSYPVVRYVGVMQFLGKSALLSPYGAYFSSDLQSIVSSSGSKIYNEDILISSHYVAILNSTYFPDANFRGYLQRSLFPKGYITESDVNATTSMNASSEYISSLQGLEYFSKLVNLACEENNLTWIPSLPSTLKYLNCRDNQLTYLPPLPSGLTTLICDQNQLNALPTMPSSLQILECENNKLSGMVRLSDLSLKSLLINNNPNMTMLQCYNNALTSLNLAGCSSLTAVYCDYNQLTSLNNIPTSLQTLDCSDNKLSGTFNLTGRSNLKTLNISGNPSLTTLNCYSNALTSLNVAGCTALTKLDCNSNQLTSLEVGSLSNLTELSCYNNKLTSLYLANKSKLKKVRTYTNQLTSLNVNGCTALQELVCGQNKLSSLSVQGCNALRDLNIHTNQIKESAMTTLINSLCTIPVGSTGNFKVIYPGNSSGGYTEGNVITNAQIIAARNKRWIPMKFAKNTNSWVEIPVNVPGDVNGDGTVTAADITALYDVLLNNDYSQIVNGDQTGDGVITAADVTAVYTIMLSSKE